MAATWTDDNNEPVKAVSAEQHALDNPGHTIRVVAQRDLTEDGFRMLMLKCGGTVTGGCPWWDEQGVKDDGA
jgi:hypothetical protein